MKQRFFAGVTVFTLLLAATQSATAQQVDTTPLKLKIEPAFPHLKWSRWSPLDDRGRPQPMRPIVVTHAGDGSHRLFVGMIHGFPNRRDAKATKLFLDLRKKVVYHDKKNEEGLLGMAFHPKYKTDGRLFVYYTTTAAPSTSVISSFRVTEDDPDKADPDSEVEILRIKQPFWNHNGGTIVFGPDGYLYVGLGDGGSAKDPFKNGQNLSTLLGSILRIDVDRKERGRNYAIPRDNPFVRRSKARPEIWAYGLRNVWRMSFDRQNGELWAGDVGQDLWEEINIIRKGGNYGWNLREAKHPFGKTGSARRRDLIDPIWEYDHKKTGKSITGGHVYRGKRVPELTGKYVYADYVSGKIWALDYNARTRRVTSNRPIPGNKMPIITFGEDEAREIYFCIVSAKGQGIYRFSSPARKTKRQVRRK
ncbi:MAG: PQQ-dependent sugar dehydrogenase [Planctomycetaceae bacterium]